MIFHLKIIGAMLVVLSFIHILFPKYFNWKKELKTLSLINKQMMQIHTLFLALFILLLGMLCLSSAVELAESALGKKICIGLGIFWSTRLVVQFFGYSSKLWKGKTFETIIHVVFSLIWCYFSATFLTIGLS